jgi:uncharacterized membrane protein (GlpM family)
LEYVIRFIAGGVVVSLFATLADVLRPKSFAGLLGASPSIALVTLTLTFSQKGADYASLEGRSMVIGSLALAVYIWLVCMALLKGKLPALLAATALLPIWGLLAALLLVMVSGQT